MLQIVVTVTSTAKQVSRRLGLLLIGGLTLLRLPFEADRSPGDQPAESDTVRAAPAQKAPGSPTGRFPAVTPAPTSGAAPTPVTPRPTLAERMRFDTEGLRVVEHPDGRKSVHLEGRFLHLARKTIDENGKALIVCTTNHDHLTNDATWVIKTDEKQTAQVR